MDKFLSDIGGDLVVIPLSKFVLAGRGDDFFMQFNKLPDERNYGALAIKDICKDDDYDRASKAIAEQNKEVAIACIEDPESASPYMFAKRLKYGEKQYFFPIIFNATLAEYAEDGEYYGFGEESYNLRLGDELDPERKCIMRIMYAPGERIEWNEQDKEKIFSFL